MSQEDIATQLEQREEVDAAADNEAIAVAKAEVQISPEARALAHQTLNDSLGVEVKEDLSDFSEKLTAATKSLPRYQAIAEQLVGVEKGAIAKKVFDLLKKGADKPETDTDIPKDGVLIRSMKQGRLECAGRSLIASTLLQEAGVEHAVVSAPGHSFIVLEQDADTLAYFDANNDLYFTFPREALKGYVGADVTTECELQKYTPRAKDVADGITTIFPHFVSMPAQEGVGRQYLGNVAAALNGNEEAAQSGFPVDKNAAEAANQFMDQAFGENSVMEDFYGRMAGLVQNEDLRRLKDKEVLAQIYSEHPTHDDFVEFFVQTLADDGQLIERLPFLRGQAKEFKSQAAERAWSLIQSGAFEKAVGER